MLLALLVVIVLYIPYAARLPDTLGPPGVNVLTVFFVAALCMRLGQKDPVKRHAPYKRRFVFFIACLVFSWLIATLRGDGDVLEDLTYLKNYIFYLFLFFLYFHSVRTKASARLVVGAILAVALLGMLQAIRQGLDYGIGSFGWTHRASGPFAVNWTEANRAGVYFAMFTPAFLAIALYYKGHKWLRLGAAAAVPAGLFAIFVTYSRQSYVIVALVMLLLLARKSWIILPIALVPIVTFEAWAPSAAIERMEMTYQEKAEGAPEAAAGDSQYDISTESRWILWGGALRMVQEKPWGIGLIRFHRDISKYTQFSLDAHNGYVLTVAESGIQGLVALLALMFAMVQLGWSVVSRPSDSETLTIGMIFLAATAGILLGNLYGSPFYYGNLMGDYWALAGVVARYALLARDGAPDAAPLRTDSKGRLRFRHGAEGIRGTLPAGRAVTTHSHA